MLHNYYQHKGGEDQVFTAEAGLLEERGHSVKRYTLHNDLVDGMSGASLASNTVWNRRVHHDLRALIRDVKPDVAHFHNTFPLISPAAYYAFRSEGVPVVQTLHNYRLLCLNAQFFREGGVCEDCLGRRVPLPGVLRSCYRGERVASAGVATMLTTHRILRTWSNVVDGYIALTRFARDKFVEGGLPPEKIFVKPNFVERDPGAGVGGGGYVLFVGRLSREKGIETLLRAWRRLGRRITLKIAGDGPLSGEVGRASRETHGIEWLGRVREHEVTGLMKRAEFLVLPSLWYEGFPMVVAEAYASGLPVLASDLGSLSTLVIAGKTGLKFSPRSAGDLEDKAEALLDDPALLERLRLGAREEFETHYTADRNYARLMEIYARVA